MALKLNVHEYCQRCGQRAAWPEGDFIVGDHNCTNRLPGRPRDPPYYFHKNSVNFIPRDNDSQGPDPKQAEAASVSGRERTEP